MSGRTYREEFDAELERQRAASKAPMMSSDNFNRRLLAAQRSAAAVVLDVGAVSDTGRDILDAVDRLSRTLHAFGQRESEVELRRLEDLLNSMGVISAQLMKPPPKHLPLSTVPESQTASQQPVRTWADRDPVSGKQLVVSKFHNSLSPNELTDFDLKLMQVLRNANGGMDEAEAAKRLGCKPDATFKGQVARLVRMGRIQSF